MSKLKRVFILLLMICIPLILSGCFDGESNGDDDDTDRDVIVGTW